MFLPSGRVHALGSGLVISKSSRLRYTYRVFGLEPQGMDGNRANWHVEQGAGQHLISTISTGIASRITRKLPAQPFFRVLVEDTFSKWTC